MSDLPRLADTKVHSVVASRNQTEILSLCCLLLLVVACCCLLLLVVACCHWLLIIMVIATIIIPGVLRFKYFS